MLKYASSIPHPLPDIALADQLKSLGPSLCMCSPFPVHGRFTSFQAYVSTSVSLLPHTSVGLFVSSRSMTWPMSALPRESRPSWRRRDENAVLYVKLVPSFTVIQAIVSGGDVFQIDPILDGRHTFPLFGCSTQDLFHLPWGI